MEAHTAALDFVSLRSMLHQLILKKWVIIGIALLFSLLSLAYAHYKPTVYQASLLLQIQQNTNHRAHQIAEPLSAQIALMKSKFILTPVIHDLGLDIVVKKPKQLAVSTLDVPNKYIDKKLNVIVEDENHFALYAGHHLLVKGEVGEVNKNKNVSIKIDHINAALGSKFVVIKQSESETVNKVLSHLKILNLSNSNDSQDNKLSLLQMIYSGQNPLEVTRVVNKIAMMTQEKSIERKNTLAERQYLFLNQQLPIVKKSLEAAERSLNQYRFKTKKMDISLQRQNLMSQLSTLDKQLNELRMQKMMLLQQYTEYYPEVKVITAKIHQLSSRRVAFYEKLKKLPVRDEKSTQLMRDIKIKSGLYMSLLNNIHQLEVEKSGIMSDITILDAATVPELPLRLNLIVVGTASLLVGLVLGSILVFVFKLVFKHEEQI